MQVIIDRFEDNYAVVEMESGGFSHLPAELLPEGAKEGSVLSIVIDKEEQKNREKEISDKMKKLFLD